MASSDTGLHSLRPASEQQPRVNRQEGEHLANLLKSAGGVLPR